MMREEKRLPELQNSIAALTPGCGVVGGEGFEPPTLSV